MTQEEKMNAITELQKRMNNVLMQIGSSYARLLQRKDSILEADIQAKVNLFHKLEIEMEELKKL